MLEYYSIFGDIAKAGILMCKEEEKCEFEHDLRGCALKHISEARKLISKRRFEDADLELSYAEKHLKEA